MTASLFQPGWIQCDFSWFGFAKLLLAHITDRDAKGGDADHVKYRADDEVPQDITCGKET